MTLNDRTVETLGLDDVSFPMVISHTSWQTLRISDRDELDILIQLLDRARVILDTKG